MSTRAIPHLMLWYDDIYFQQEDHGFDMENSIAKSHKRAIGFIKAIIKKELIYHFYRLDFYLLPHDNSIEAMDLLLKVKASLLFLNVHTNDESNLHLLMEI